MSILYADNNEDARLTTWFTQMGHTVTFASTGRGAIQLGLKHHFDLVLVEVILRDADGLDVIKAFNKNQPITRIIAMSAGGTYVDAEYCLKLAAAMGAHTLLLKPFDRDGIIGAVEVAMAGEHRSSEHY